MLRCKNCLGLPLTSVQRTSCLLLLATVVTVSCLSCPAPCTPESCSSIDISNCSYGTVKDACECCDVCGRGPGDPCGEGGATFYGRCGDDMTCTKIIPEELIPVAHLLTEKQLESLEGNCTVLENATTVPPATSVSPSTQPRPSTDPTVDCDNSTSSGDKEEMTDPHMCRPQCSREFCSTSKKQRICSARGLEYTKNSQRNDCQHTSCFACFILVEPPCEEHKCPEPPNKSCLRRYYQCLVDHYIHAESSSRIRLMRINDNRRNDYPGRVICHVPQVSSEVS